MHVPSTRITKQSSEGNGAGFAKKEANHGSHSIGFSRALTSAGLATRRSAHMWRTSGPWNLVAGARHIVQYSRGGWRVSELLLSKDARSREELTFTELKRTSDTSSPSLSPSRRFFLPAFHARFHTPSVKKITLHYTNTFTLCFVCFFLFNSGPMDLSKSLKPSTKRIHFRKEKKSFLRLIGRPKWGNITPFLSDEIVHL